MLKDLIMQILGKKKVLEEDSPKVDGGKFKIFKFKPLYGDCEPVKATVLKDVTLNDYKKEIKLLKIPQGSKELAYLKVVWNENFSNQPWR